MREVSFGTEDGVLLTGYIFEASDPKCAVIIHGATGVPCRYYQDFAAWLSETVSANLLIYRYRDTGQLSKAQLSSSKTTMADWGMRDQPAALKYAVENWSDIPLHVIGHSLGGFCTLFHENREKITSLIGVNSGLAYWRDHPLKFMPQIILFWFLLGPMSVMLLGYLPGILLGMKTNLPKGVYWQWRKWCTNPKLHEIEWGESLPMPNLDLFKGHLCTISAVDDEIIPPNRVKMLTRFYPKAKSKEHIEIKPKDFGLKAIGHISIFSAKNKAVWPELIKSI